VEFKYSKSKFQNSRKLQASNFNRVEGGPVLADHAGKRTRISDFIRFSTHCASLEGGLARHQDWMARVKFTQKGVKITQAWTRHGRFLEPV
jgi:hypothetical protein